MFKIASNIFHKNSVFLGKFAFSSKTFPNFNELQTFLKNEKPVLSCMYFRAKWNPMCEKADEDFEKLPEKYPGVEFIKLDTDKDHLFKSYFGVKVEPEFVVTCLGCEMIRHTGLNLSSLGEKITRVNEFYKSCEFLGNTAKYEEFQEQFMEEYNTIWKLEDYWLR